MLSGDERGWEPGAKARPDRTARHCKKKSIMRQAPTVASCRTMAPHAATAHPPRKLRWLR
eukprot:11243956-Karenia_brevis.AAC.1